jgi:pimeloyl-ACP methyl ester carboxylesterase
LAVEWEIITSGPEDAQHGVLLLPGGANPALSFEDVMADPSLAGVRLVAATLPGHAGTMPPDNFSVESYAQGAAKLATAHRCRVVVGFSMGATVALEVAASGLHDGPVVLLGISLSQADEPRFFLTVARLSPKLGGLPITLLMRLTAMAAKRAQVSPKHREAMVAALRRDDARLLGRAIAECVEYLGRHEAPAERLCQAGVPSWVVHAEKGDGGLTDQERRTLEECPHVHVSTWPGTCYFLPDERPADVANLIADAVRSID